MDCDESDFEINVANKEEPKNKKKRDDITFSFSVVIQWHIFIIITSVPRPQQ